MDKGQARGGRWRLADERGPAEALHCASAAGLDRQSLVRTVRVCRADRPALVLGSHQRASMWDERAARAAGVDMARRRSGGSAVLVGPGRVVWVDLLIPAGDPLWDRDVGRAAWWVGELWASVIPGAEVWKGPMRTGPWSAAVCFAGLGPGEVTVAGRKVVGVCQRRTPKGVLFQTAALLRWEPGDYTELLAEPVGDPAGLADAATGLGSGSEEAIITDLLGRLMP